MKKFWNLFLFLLPFLFYSHLKADVEFDRGDRIVLYGNSFIERMQQNGFFEAALHMAHPEKELELRSLAWTGDELGYRLRPERYVNHLKNS